jgi:hypothetical protein
MGVDLRDWVTFIQENASEYIGTFIEVLAHPGRLNRLVPERSDPDPSALVSSDAAPKPKFDSSAVVFVVISLAIGFTLGAIIPNRDAVMMTRVVMINVTILWLLWSAVTHQVCRRFGGKRSFGDTASVTLRVFAVGYVVSNFLTFFVGNLGKVYEPIRLGDLSTLLFYFVVQVLFLLIYIPATTGALHQLSRAGRVTAGAMSAMLCLVFGVPMYVIGGC